MGAEAAKEILEGPGSLTGALGTIWWAGFNVALSRRHSPRSRIGNVTTTWVSAD